MQTLSLHRADLLFSNPNPGFITFQIPKPSVVRSIKISLSLSLSFFAGLEMAAELHAKEPRLLTLTHRAHDLWDAEDTTTLHCRRVDSGPWGLRIDPRVMHLLLQAGFYGVCRIGNIRLDRSLITALVERWRQETHTFHMPVGECTVTLQDVAVLFGLPVDGAAVILPDRMRTRVEWQDMCLQQLGATVPDYYMVSGRVNVSWFHEHFRRSIPADAPTQVIQQRARALILWLIGGFLMPDKSQKLIKLVYLPFLQDFGQVHSYSWGAAVLAYLYRQLCRATKPGRREITGPLVLLQIWAWERFPRIAPARSLDVGPGQAPIQHGDIILPIGPWGSRWRVNFTLDLVSTHAVTIFRDQFDRMTADEIVWMPYGAVDEIIVDLPDYCRLGMDTWMARSPLICIDVVEWHLPDRVLRQFGRWQTIPQHPDTDAYLHSFDRNGRFNKNWTQIHAGAVTLWNKRRDDIVVAPQTSVPMGFHDPYMQWFRRVSYLLITNPIHRWAHGYVGGVGVVNELERFAADMYRRADEWIRNHSPCDSAFSTLVGFRTGAYTALIRSGREHQLQPSTAPSTSSQPPRSAHSMGSPASPSDTPIAVIRLQFSSPACGYLSSIPSSSTPRTLHRDITDMTQGVTQTQLQASQRPPLPVRGRGRGRGRDRGRARDSDMATVPVGGVSQASAQSHLTQVVTHRHTTSASHTVANMGMPMDLLQCLPLDFAVVQQHAVPLPAQSRQDIPTAQGRAVAIPQSPSYEVPLPLRDPGVPTSVTASQSPSYEVPTLQDTVAPPPTREGSHHYVRRSKRPKAPSLECGT